MADVNEAIVRTVESCIDSLCEEFQTHSTMFYTENDLTCRLYSMLQLSACDLSATDGAGKVHKLVHTEYPTPFRCDMNGNSFLVADDFSASRRGHYDLVVLNPGLVRNHSYSEIYGQSFKRSKQTIIPWSKREGPMILYGVEVMLRRKALGTSRRLAVGSWNNRMAKFKQDCDKLLECQNQGLMMRTKGIFFIREHNPELQEFILAKVPQNGRICWG